MYIQAKKLQISVPERIQEASHGRRGGEGGRERERGGHDRRVADNDMSFIMSRYILLYIFTMRRYVNIYSYI
jgi:hypothetical protein